MGLKNIAINSGLVFVSLVLFFGFAEVAVRLSGIASTRPASIDALQSSENPLIGYELKPGSRTYSYGETVTVNTAGFRGKELDLTKSLIAVVGDSITFGYNLPDDQSIPAHLDDMMPSHEVINAGVPGYNVIQETQTYRDKIAPLEPEALVMIFFFNDADMDIPVLDAKGFLRPKDWSPEDRTCDPIRTGIMQYVPFKCWLDLNSAFYVAFKRLVNMLHSFDALEQKQAVERADPSADPFTPSHVSAYERVFDEFSDSLDDDMVKIFVIWPDYHLHEESIPELTRIASENGFSVLNLYDHFGNDIDTLPGDSIHPTGDMSRGAAGIISQFLEPLLR